MPGNDVRLANIPLAPALLGLRMTTATSGGGFGDVGSVNFVRLCISCKARVGARGRGARDDRVRIGAGIA